MEDSNTRRTQRLSGLERSPRLEHSQDSNVADATVEDVNVDSDNSTSPLEYDKDLRRRIMGPLPLLYSRKRKEE